MRHAWQAGLACCVPLLAQAHAGPDGGQADTGAIVVLLLLLLPALLYALGLARLRRETAAAGPALLRVACFVAGELVLAAWLLPPLDGWSAGSFAAHMVQHEVLMLVAAPLLVLGRPLPVFLWAFPPRARQRLAGWTRQAMVRGAWRTLMHPATGWSCHAAALWIWHLPPLFRAALQGRGLHDLQHLSFVLTALLFWSGLLLARAASRRGAAVVYLFTTTIHTSLLGAFITLADRPLYAPHVLAVQPVQVLQDQQLGGLIMWVPGAMVYVAAGLGLFLQWLRCPAPRTAD